MKTNLILICTILVFGLGCERRGRTGPTQAMDKIVIRHAGDWHYEEGGAGGCTGTMVARYKADIYGELSSPGIRMDAEITGNDDDFSVLNIDRVTDEEGFCRITNIRSFEPLVEGASPNGMGHRAACRLINPTTGYRSGELEFFSGNQLDCRTFPDYELVPWAYYGNYNCPVCGMTHAVFGGYYCCYTRGVTEGVNPVVSYNPGDPYPIVVSSVGQVTNGLLDSEEQALNNPELPSTGLTVDVRLVQIMNDSSVRDVTDMFVPFNHFDPNTYRDHAYPMMYSVTVSLSEPIEWDGTVYSARVHSSNGQSIDIDISIIESNADNTVHIARTDMFLPIDTTLFPDPNDPNSFEVVDKWNDPNDIIECPAVPVDVPGGYLEFEFVPNDSELIKIGASEWLGNNKCLDINNDGIVNLKDFFFGF